MSVNLKNEICIQDEVTSSDRPFIILRFTLFLHNAVILSRMLPRPKFDKLVSGIES